MKKNTLLLHLFGFLIVFLIVTTFVFYQTFVDSNHQRIPLSVFLRPKVFLQAVAKLGAQKPPFDESALYWFDVNKIVSMKGAQPISDGRENMMIFVVNNTVLLTGFLDNKLFITNFTNDSISSFTIDNARVVTVVGWLDESRVVLDVWNQSHSIWELNIQTQQMTQIVSEIVYKGSVLPITTASGFSTLIYPDCSAKCFAVELDLEKRTQIAKYPLFTEPSHAASLDDVRLLFADNNVGLIGYEVPGSRDIYIIDRDLNLLQYIRQENDRDEALFGGYFPQTQQMLFVLHERSTGEQTVALSKVNFPSLHVLNTFSADQSILVSRRPGAYQIGDTIYDLNGELVRKIYGGELIQTY